VRFQSVVSYVVAAAVVASGAMTISGGASAADTQPAAKAAKVRPFVTGWLPYWSPESSTSSVVRNAALFDVASPFVFDVESAKDVDLKVSADAWQTMRARLRDAGVPIVATLATDLTADQFAAILSNDDRRRAHINTLVRLADRYNLRGLDLDYESINFGSSSAKQTVRSKYPVLVDALEAKLQADGRILAVTVAARRSVDDPNWMVFDYAALGAAADRIRVMTYDYHWSGGAPGPMAPKSWVDEVMSFASKQMPSTKLSVGLPAYGRDWFVKKLSGTCPASARASISRSTEAMQSFARKRNITPKWVDSATSRKFSYTQRYSSGGQSCKVQRVAWYDDARSVRAKTQLVKKYELGGVALWALGYETSGIWGSLRDFGRRTAMRTPSVRVSAPDTLRVGDRGVVRARLVDSGDPVKNHRVTLQRRVGSTGGWDTVNVDRTDARGKARLGVSTRMHVHWRVVSAPSWQYERAVSSVSKTRARR